VLVWKRTAYGEARAERWWSAIWATTLVHTLWNAGDGGVFEPIPDVPIRMPLEDMIEILHAAGYGDGR
jgi:hypothetical protein